MKLPNIALIVTLFVFIGIIFTLVFLGINDEKQWDEFTNSHNCIMVGKKESEILPTILSNGKVGMGVIPSQTAYKCDDNITYWR